MYCIRQTGTGLGTLTRPCIYVCAAVKAYNEKIMILDLNDVLDQFHAWNKSESGVRITTDGKSWVTKSLNVVKDSILFDQKGAELGSVQTLKLDDAEVFERTDETITARWKSGKTVQFQKENPDKAALSA